MPLKNHTHTVAINLICDNMLCAKLCTISEFLKSDLFSDHLHGIMYSTVKLIDFNSYVTFIPNILLHSFHC